MKLWLPGRFPGLNDLLRAKGSGHHKYNALKKRAADRVGLLAGAQRFSAKEGHFSWLFVEPDRRRDLDGIAGGAQKLILDGLEKCGAIPGDGWKVLEGDTRFAHVDRSMVGVFLCVYPCPILTREHMLALLQKFCDESHLKNPREGT